MISGKRQSEPFAMDEDSIEQLKQLRCGPCKNDRGIEKLAHVMF
jgi:hypothetical protein